MDQSWYWTDRWQQAEREVDEWKTSGQRGEPLDIERALKVLDALAEEAVEEYKAGDTQDIREIAKELDIILD